MSFNNTLIAIAAVLATTPVWAGKPVVENRAAIVGHTRMVKVEPDLSRARRVAGDWVWSQTVLIPGASFLKIHLVNVNLQGDDRLVVRKHDGRVIETITGRGPKDMGSFWALSVPGDSAVLELIYRVPYKQHPFTVDKVVAGDAGLFGAGDTSADRSVCGIADFEDVVCYQDDADKWNNVQASVGVMSLGGNADFALYCSGANVSPRNYILTNNHCVASQLHCDSTEYVFRYYRTGCNDGSAPTQDWVSYRCGEIVASEPLVECDAAPGTLDYSLTTVIGEPASIFGYVQPDNTPLADGEALYIVQHPAGRPHEITHGTDTVVDGSVLRYWNTLDTESGSSGSMIFRESDDAVVGLHHCGGCANAAQRNRGMLMTDLYPIISPYLCTEEPSLVAADPGPLTELAGNQNGVMEAGETWSFVPAVLNASCSGTINNAVGNMTLGPGNEADVVLLDTTAGFASIDAGSVVSAASAVRFRIAATTQCGDAVAIDMSTMTTDQGVFPGENQILTAVGAESFDTIFFEDFANGIPADWTVNNLGSGSGPAETWTADNPGNRPIALSAPFVIADSDQNNGQMDEELITPIIDATGYPRVLLQFTHDFHWYFSGGNEQGDVDIRSSATLGGWINVANFSGADATGTVSIDITQWVGTNLEIRFRYYSAVFDWWWAVDDVTVLGSTGFECETPGDGDSDGVLDDYDNCLTTANPSQTDSDNDGIGNACDGDIGAVSDCFVNFADLAMLNGALFSQAGQPSWNPDADFNDDGIINFFDLQFMREHFLRPPGPSGIENACQAP